MVIKTIEKSTELIVILIFSPQLFRSSSSMNSLWMGVLAKLHTFLSWHFWMFLVYLGLAFDILMVHGRFYIFFLSWFTFTLTFQSVPPANSRLAPLPPEPYDRGATIDIPLDSAQVSVHIHDVELPCSIYAVFEQFFFPRGEGLYFFLIPGFASKGEGTQSKRGRFEKEGTGDSSYCFGLAGLFILCSILINKISWPVILSSTAYLFFRSYWRAC